MLSQLLFELDALEAGAEPYSEVLGVHANSCSGRPGAQDCAPSPSLVVIGCTNTPDALDPALLRPGRLEHLLYMPPPLQRARAAILATQLRCMPLGMGGELSSDKAGTHQADATGETLGAADSASEATIVALARHLAERTAGFTGADLIGLCQRAALIALQQHGPLPVVRSPTAEPDLSPAQLVLSSSDFDKALQCVTPSVTAAMLARLKQWRNDRCTRGDGGARRRARPPPPGSDLSSVHPCATP